MALARQAFGVLKIGCLPGSCRRRQLARCDWLGQHGVVPEEALKNILAGGLCAPPFPASAVHDARVGLKSLAKGTMDAWEPAGPPQAMLIEARLAGALLQELDDPDWEIFRVVEAGVRIGVGVSLPRSPLVFPEKRKWNVAGQESADPDLLYGLT